MRKSSSKIIAGFTISFLVLILVWLITIFPNAQSMPMGYLSMGFFVIIPVSTLLCGLLVGLSGYLIAISYPIIVTGGSVLVNYFSYGINQFNISLDLLIILPLIPSLIGFSAGMIIFHFRKKRA